MRTRWSDDLTPVLDLLAAAESAPDPASLRAGAVAALATLVPCDHVVWGELDVASLAPRAIAASGGAGAGIDLTAFARHVGEHPLVLHHLRTGTDAPLLLSDFVSRRELHALGVYEDFYRPLGTEHALCVALRGRGVAVGIAFHRSRRDFRPAERRLVARVRPALRTVLRHEDALRDTPQPLTHPALTRRESEVLEQVAAGRSNGEVAALLGLSPRTVEKHLEHVYAKLQVPGRFALAAYVRSRRPTPSP
jgi:DNA-binding CsgD family transcriptional regulator